MTKVLLVKLDKAAGGKRHISLSEPIGICYIGAYLQKNGIDCSLMHLLDNNKSWELIHKKIKGVNPSIIGFSIRCFNFYSTSNLIKKVQKYYPEVKIALGGECITENNAVEIASKTQADLVVIGDGESSIFNYASGKSLETIPEIVYRSASGTYLQTKGPAVLIPPDQLPMMMRDGLPMEQYSSDAFPGKRYATMHVQRGCRFKCSFCHTAGRYRQVCSRNVEQILEEIEFLVNTYGIQSLSIWDEDFFINPYRAAAIADGLIAMRVPLQWQTYMKLSDLKNPDIIKLLPQIKKSGFSRAIIGIESFIPRIQKQYHKSCSADAEKLLKHLSDNDIFVCPTYIIGAPDETCDETNAGINKLEMLRSKGIKIDLPYISFLTPFPGTAIYDDNDISKLLIDQDWSHYDGEHVIFKSGCSPQDMMKIWNNFYENESKACSSR